MSLRCVRTTTARLTWLGVTVVLRPNLCFDGVTTRLGGTRLGGMSEAAWRPYPGR